MVNGMALILLILLILSIQLSILFIYFCLHQLRDIFTSISRIDLLQFRWQSLCRNPTPPFSLLSLTSPGFSLLVFHQAISSLLSNHLKFVQDPPPVPHPSPRAFICCATSLLPITFYRSLMLAIVENEALTLESSIAPCFAT